VRRSGRLVVLMVVAALLGGTSTGLAQPTPPPNPSDDELQRSRDTVSQRAGEVGQLTSLLADLDQRTDDLQAALAAQRETAEAALVDLESARDAAAQAVRRADGARIETEAASVAIVEAGARLDEFLTATYHRGLGTGPLALLTDATSPEDLVTRAEFDDAVGRQQIAAQDGLERARAGKANADSTARAALEDAREREAAAEGAKATADAALAAADAAARAQAVELAAVAAERTGVQARLDTAESQDTGLRQQRERFDDWQRRIAAEQAARERAEREAAAARVLAAERAAAEADARSDARSRTRSGATPDAGPSRGSDPGPVATSAGGGREAPAARGGSGAAQRVIDRAKSHLGVQYVWGGGNGRGPSTGIPDAFGSPLNRVGFDCSGLMLYAFNGVGVSLPRVSRNQYDAGRKVPISDIRPGDMVFYRNGGAPIHHVALYVGNGRMIEAPYTGSDVRLVPLRSRGLLPQATRVL